MAHENQLFPLGHFEHHLIQKKVRQIVGRAGIRPQERHDLEHDLVLQLVKALEAFEPKRGHLHAFVTAVIERAVATLLRDRRAAKRQSGQLASLDILVESPDGDIESLADTIDERKRPAACSPDPQRTRDLIDLRIDLGDLLALLPDRERQLVDDLMHKTKAQIAREMGIPRTTLQDQVRALRKRFEHAGLREYL